MPPTALIIKHKCNVGGVEQRKRFVMEITTSLILGASTTYIQLVVAASCLTNDCQFIADYFGSSYMCMHGFKIWRLF